MTGSPISSAVALASASPRASVVPGTIGTCDCPSGFPGAQECGFDGTYLPCECDDPQAHSAGKMQPRFMMPLGSNSFLRPSIRR